MGGDGGESEYNQNTPHKILTTNFKNEEKRCKTLKKKKSSVQRLNVNSFANRKCPKHISQWWGSEHLKRFYSAIKVKDNLLI